ncbi:hypothetical protein ACIP9H_40445 [Streptomyces sp. NPDC088732]|uniref:hypothetical protein n=1 Tax=Streptomyces sp. NPDC088732 TaxID=3365879 RepID=UPI0037FAFDEE
MAIGNIPVTIQCPACDATLQIPTSARQTGLGYAVLDIDTSAVRAHIARHERSLRYRLTRWLRRRTRRTATVRLVNSEARFTPDQPLTPYFTGDEAPPSEPRP